MAVKNKKEVVRVACAQINATVGDLAGNGQKIVDWAKKAQQAGAEIVVFPELALTGYPPEDLLLKPKFVADNLQQLKSLAGKIKGIVAVVGFVDREDDRIYNAAAVIYQGKVKGVYRKILLPNYGVFDEKRYFQPGEQTPIFRWGEVDFGLLICEDIWQKKGPASQEIEQGADLILVLNASPYHAGKIQLREKAITSQAKLNRTPVVYVNLVGGQDELVFDGQSLAVDGEGKVAGRADAFREELLVVDLPLDRKKERPEARPEEIKPLTIANRVAVKKKPKISLKLAKALDPIEEIYQALTLGLRDYTAKTGFQKVVIGLSGGIDSALVAVLAADALGAENVTGVFMPSRYSSRESQIDAQKLAHNLNLNLITVSIEPMYQTFLKSLKPHFGGREMDTTEENLQARIRGSILMALSNKFDWLVLTTGNKSEMATGYATLYGDMAGGFAVVKDVPKTLIYKLGRWRNKGRPEAVPKRILSKTPTAELKPDQKDSDTLPPYDTLDPILKAYVEEDRSIGQIIEAGFDRATVSRVLELVDRSEYKRRQAPPGIKITPKSFGKDRRMPISNKHTN